MFNQTCSSHQPKAETYHRFPCYTEGLLTFPSGHVFVKHVDLWAVLFCSYNNFMKLPPHWNMVLRITWTCVSGLWSLIFGSRINHLWGKSFVDICNISAILMKKKSKSWRHIIEGCIKVWVDWGPPSYSVTGFHLLLVETNGPSFNMCLLIPICSCLVKSLHLTFA